MLSTFTVRTSRRRPCRPSVSLDTGSLDELLRLRADNARLVEALRASEARSTASEKELRALAQHVMDVREDERKHVARELHDELGQVLTAIEMELRAMARSHKGLGEDKKARFEELLNITHQSIRSVQRLCSELRPAVLDKLGLSAAVEWLAEDVSSRSALIPSLTIGIREEAIGPRASIALFRMIQESLTNIVRHAGASSFMIELIDTGQAVRLIVRDDGVGISEAEAMAPCSFGIQGIRERARTLGGNASVRGETGRGTSLEIWLPFRADGRLP